MEDRRHEMGVQPALLALAFSSCSVCVCVCVCECPCVCVCMSCQSDVIAEPMLQIMLCTHRNAYTHIDSIIYDKVIHLPP